MYNLRLNESPDGRRCNEEDEIPLHWLTPKSLTYTRKSRFENYHIELYELVNTDIEKLHGHIVAAMKGVTSKKT